MSGNVALNAIANTVDLQSEVLCSLKGYFEAMSSPATSMEIPANATTYANFDPAPAVAPLHEVFALAAKYGIKMLTPEETAELLPHYSGFGVSRLG